MLLALKEIKLSAATGRWNRNLLKTNSIILQKNIKVENKWTIT